MDNGRKAALSKRYEVNRTCVDSDTCLPVAAEDVPLVSNFGTGFKLKPRDFFDRAAFEDLVDYPGMEKDEEPCPA